MKLKYLLISIFFFILGCGFAFNGVSNPNLCPIVEKELPSKNVKLYHSFSYFLIIIIISKAGNVQQRRAIRETWGSLQKNNSDVNYFFIVGGKNLPQQQSERLVKEQIKNNDLFVLSVADNYDMLTQKVLKAFVWFETEFNFKYILKCDDDSFVIIPRVLDNLRNSLSTYTNLYWGYFDGRAHVKQSGKWKDTSWYLCDRYLPYSLGGGYVLSHSLVHYIKINEPLLG